MAIQIRVPLTASPNPTSLPRRIDFHQTLRGNIDGETVLAVYELDPDHDIWFQDANGKPTKTVQRSLEVSQAQADQVFLIRIVMQRGPGTGPLAMVEIDQTLTDSSGIKTPDSFVLNLS
jgi:hypothetical protein